LNTFIILLVANQIAGVGGPVDPGHCDRYTRMSNIQIERMHVTGAEYFDVRGDVRFLCRDYTTPPVVEFKGEAKSL
jgi:hypothetical protein